MIKFTPDTAKVGAAFDELTKPGSPSMQRALEAFARVLRTRIQLGFRQGKSPKGTSWAPLKVRKGGQPLRNTGRLYGSIQVRRDGAGGIVVGSNLKIPGSGNSLGAVHQFGMTIKPKTKPFLVFPGMGKALIFARQVTIPARPFMPLDAAGAVALPPSWEKSALSAMAKALELPA
jgi:phage gpG-like protein